MDMQELVRFYAYSRIK